MDWGPRYLGGRKQIWSVLAGTRLQKHSTVKTPRKDQRAFLFEDFRFCSKIHQSERWRGRPSEAPKQHSLAQLPFTHSSSTSNKVEQDKRKAVVFFFLFMFCKTIVTQAPCAPYMTCYLLCLIFPFIKGFCCFSLRWALNPICEVGCGTQDQAIAARQRKVKAGQQQWGYRQI